MEWHNVPNQWIILSTKIPFTDFPHQWPYKYHQNIPLIKLFPQRCTQSIGMHPYQFSAINIPTHYQVYAQWIPLTPSNIYHWCYWQAPDFSEKVTSRSIPTIAASMSNRNSRVYSPAASPLQRADDIQFLTFYELAHVFLTDHHMLVRQRLTSPKSLSMVVSGRSNICHQ